MFCSFQYEVHISCNLWAKWNCPCWATQQLAQLEVAVIPLNASQACWSLLLLPLGAACFQCHPSTNNSFWLLQPRSGQNYFHLGFFICQLWVLPSAHFLLKKVHLLTISWALCLLAKHLQQHIISALLMSNKRAKNYMPMLIYAILFRIMLEMHEFHVSCWALLYFHVPVSTTQGNFISVLSRSQYSMEYFVFLL